MEIFLCSIACAILVTVIGCAYYCVNAMKKLKENLQNEDSKNIDNWKNMILTKQQETLTTINEVGKSYQNITDALAKMNISNATSTQIITDMSSHISSMSDIMVNKKARGNWGEYQLNSLLSLYAGDNREVFDVQYALSNGYIGDAALHLPDTEKVMIIDSKFPMENYQNIINCQNGNDEKRFVQLFKTNIKKHINDIARKYIMEETTEQAVMFVPSEAVFTYICAEHADLIDYAQGKRVLITSPTTLIGVVFTLVNATKDFNRAKNIKEIEKTIIAMEEDAKRLNDRVENTQKYMLQMQKSLHETKISSDKITNKIHKVADGYVENE